MADREQGKDTGHTQVSFPEIELRTLAFWQSKAIFERSLEARKDSKPYVFYDGPPFATGLPHHGHLLASTLKDIIPRYFTMQGYYVERRFGWDCHGLPIEYEIDKQEGQSTQELVERIGIAGYNDLCRAIVQRYTEQWRQTITRLGRWVDFDHGYKTMDPDFMESVWWVFKQLWDKDLVYQGTKVVPFSTALGTVLSNFEASSHYQDVQDPALTVLLPLLSDEHRYLAIWTTTPWTLPSNLGVCVGPDIQYCLVKPTAEDARLIWVAEARLSEVFDSETVEVISTCLGHDLVGQAYQPPFEYFIDERQNGAFQVYADDFVTTEDGTGLVHMAPAFGEDDHRIMIQAGVEAICPIDDQGCFTAEVPDFEGQSVKAADALIIQALKKTGHVWAHSTVVHSYPHCPRSDTPLIYRTIPSWYIRVTALKDRLLAANEQIHWQPAHVKTGRFGHWLSDVKDWAVSRNRVWGTPVPLWINDQTGQVCCIGSRAELAELTGIEVTDLHREHVDALTFERSGEAGVYRRVPEVLDCWFESGAMPYAQSHYPFEASQKFEAGFPAQFIAEGLDQTRGWFYTLTVLAVALFDQPAFKNVIVSGIVMAADGKKMSKRLKNYTPPNQLMEEYGADALRLYLISGGLVKAQEQRFSDHGVKEMVRQVLLPWYNASKFLTTYAEVDHWQCSMSAEAYTILDQWLLSRLHSFKTVIQQAMSEYAIQNIVPEALRFLEDLTNTYIRLNRTRFWAEGCDLDKCTAYTILYQAIHELTCCMAPFAPFCAEAVYQALQVLRNHSVPDSVHLCDYPQVDQALCQPVLEDAVARMQHILVLGRQCRNTAKIKTKIPLKSIKIIHKDISLLKEIEPLAQYIQSELNVQSLIYEHNEQAYIELSAQPCSPILGKRLGGRFKHFKTLIEGLSSSEIEAYEQAGSIDLEGEQFGSDDILVLRAPKPDLACVASNRWITVQLDGNLDEDLIDQGRARELINRIQKTRKAMNLNVSDRIHLTVYIEPKLQSALEQHRNLIQKETLTVQWVEASEPLDTPYCYEIEDARVQIIIRVI
jgi:isoleucyl-tRNA synthetase